MTEAGHGSQIVQVTQSHSYILDEHELEQILLAEEIKDLPVVVVSVAGAYRGGKSFLLNFFLRYLTSTPSAQQDGSWLGEDTEPLVGFQWRNGVKPTTTGILMWSQPFITTLPSGDKVAVLLIDTQGTFDSTSTVRDCSTIFALSTLISSVQIYNLFHNIQEDDLQHLQLFTEYGRLVKEQGSKAFQVLEFLVRDWQFADDYSYGAEGGERLLEEKLKITPGLDKDMKELRQHIRSSFEKVSCFLMPHPGFKVLKKTFNGSIKDIDAEFRIHLIDLVASLFSPEKLLPKTINGEQVKARSLFNYFKSYMALYNSGTIPNPTSIMKATVEAGFLSAVNDAREIYEKGMESECGTKQPSVPAVDLQELHRKYVNAACAAFTDKKKMGSSDEANKYLEKLKKEIENRLPQFIQVNLAKIQTAINKAKDSYDEAIRNISKDQLLCVHAMDLEDVHKAGLAAAIKTFDAARKRITNKQDDERTKFIQSFEKRYDLLRLANEQNNNTLVSLLRMEYWQTIQGKAISDPPLSDAEFRQAHEAARKKALDDFDLKRNIASHYTKDVYRYNLITAINNSFVELKAINKSKNKAALQVAIDTYDRFMSKAWEDRTLCLHPDDLERENQRGLCNALDVFRPSKVCQDGFDENDEDEATLKRILQQRIDELRTNNDSVNKSAVQEAYNVYVDMMEDRCRPTVWWLLIVPYIINISRRSSFHKESKNNAEQVFYSKRRDGSHYSTDPYKENLDQLINDCYQKNY